MNKQKNARLEIVRAFFVVDYSIDSQAIAGKGIDTILGTERYALQPSKNSISDVDQIRLLAERSFANIFVFWLYAIIFGSMFSNSEEFELFKIKHNNIAPAKGKVLISVPFVRDVHFHKSVILLTEHDAEGSFGFILNKGFGYRLSEVINDVEDCDIMVGYGGPVQSDTLHFIHTLGSTVPGSARVAGNLFWGGDLGTVKSLLNERQISQDQIRFFIGYSGWSPHQLHDEIHADSWLVSQLSGKDIMQYRNEYLWKLSLFKMGKKYSYWTSFPDNPSLN